MLTVGCASRPANGRAVNGDSFVVVEDGHLVLIAVIDGLGKGEEAAVASQLVRGYVEEHAGDDLEKMIRGCHMLAKKSIRGSVIGVARLDSRLKQFSYIGVGNIEVRVVSGQSIHPASMNGVLGYNLKRLRKLVYDIGGDYVVLLYSDGVDSSFDLRDYPFHRRDPQRAVDRILREFSDGKDDATIVMAVGVV